MHLSSSSDFWIGYWALARQSALTTTICFCLEFEKFLKFLKSSLTCSITSEDGSCPFLIKPLIDLALLDYIQSSMKGIKEKRWKQNLPHFGACVSWNTYSYLCLFIFTILFYVPVFIKNGNKTPFLFLSERIVSPGYLFCYSRASRMLQKNIRMGRSTLKETDERNREFTLEY